MSLITNKLKRFQNKSPKATITDKSTIIIKIVLSKAL